MTNFNRKYKHRHNVCPKMTIILGLSFSANVMLFAVPQKSFHEYKFQKYSTHSKIITWTQSISSVPSNIWEKHAVKGSTRSSHPLFKEVTWLLCIFFLWHKLNLWYCKFMFFASTVRINWVVLTPSQNNCLGLGTTLYKVVLNPIHLFWDRWSMK